MTVASCREVPFCRASLIFLRRTRQPVVPAKGSQDEVDGQAFDKYLVEEAIRSKGLIVLNLFNAA